MKYSLEEIKRYITSQDSLHNLNDENIQEANAGYGCMNYLQGDCILDNEEPENVEDCDDYYE